MTASANAEAMDIGGVAEWSNAAALNTAVSKRHREFESHRLRHYLVAVNP